MTEWVQVTVTFADEETALRMADGLVRGRMAACVQVSGPIQSIFWWGGLVHRKREWQCRAKTAADRYAELERYVHDHYQAQTPEIIAVPIVLGSADYLDWIGAETRDRADSRAPTTSPTAGLIDCQE